jgi:hypothetical protein
LEMKPADNPWVPAKGMFGYTNPEGDWRGLNPRLVITPIQRRIGGD